MSGDLAILEQKIINYVSDQLRQNGLQQLAGPDMVKSFIAVSMLSLFCFTGDFV
jgi:seryl-tRNA synthetase